MLPDLIKSALSLQNGNADDERSPSDNKNSFTKEKTPMNEETIVD